MKLIATRTLRIHACSLLVVMFGTGTLMAQKPREYLHVIQFTAPFDLAASKFIREGVRDQDPTADVWVEQPMQSVLVRAHLELDRNELQQVVGQAGLQISYLGPPENAIERGSGTDGTNRAPEYRDTGDPANDNARYEAEKRAFIAAHPDLYEQQMTDPER